MNKRLTLSCVIILMILTFHPMIISASVPKGNLVLFVSENNRCPAQQAGIIEFELERTLRQKGYSGRIRGVADGAANVSSDESTIQIIILTSAWETQKAFSIPFLLNRYRRVFVLELSVEIPSKEEKLYATTFRVVKRKPVEAQFITNDRYDPDLFPDQTERLNIEKQAYREIASRLADRLGAKLK